MDINSINNHLKSKNGDARYGLDLLSLCGRICEEEDRDYVTEEDVRQAQRIAGMMLVYRAVNKLTSSQKLLLYAIFHDQGYIADHDLRML